MFDWTEKPYLQLLSDKGVEPDQRVITAFEMLSGTRQKNHITDAELFLAFIKLNTIATRHLWRYLEVIEKARILGGAVVSLSNRAPANEATFFGGESQNVLLQRVFDSRKVSHTLGVADFLKIMIQMAIEKGDQPYKRLYTVDLLSDAFSRRQSTPLHKQPVLSGLLNEILAKSVHADDYQYILGLQDGSIVFRIVSILDDYIEESNSGLLMPCRALLTHFKDQFGGFSEDEICELSALLNSEVAKEVDFQRFFEMHPHFFRKWDYREIYPQVTLSKPEGPLIPDFILTDKELQKAAILELKLPKPKLIRRQNNRDRFTEAVMEARTQLLRYRDWFRDKENRLRLVSRIGMEIYEPQLIVVIGRASEFQDEFERQRLTADNPHIEVVTYDDILTFAKRRRIIFQ